MRRTFIAGLLFATCVLSCSRDESSGVAEVLLFSGTGTSRNDVRAFKSLLTRQAIRYATVDSATLDAMSVTQLGTYKLLIVPGGNFVEMGQGLAPATTANVRTAVRQGLNYLGVCAGAFMAGDSPYNGINLTGVRFRFYAISARGVRKAAVPISTADGQHLEHYWEDGPELSGWGAVVAKYPDGTPAVVQGAVDRGWVVLSGIHAEAPDDWRAGMPFTTPARVSNAHAASLIRAALSGAALPHF